MQINQSTVIRWVNELGSRCLGTVETNQILTPKWQGIIGLDGKYIRVGGKKMACLLATDLVTLDLPICALVSAEDEQGCRYFLQLLAQQVKSLRGIVSDLGKGKVWIKLIDELFPNVPHQACIVHFERYIDQVLPNSKHNKHFQQHQLLRHMLKQLLYASTFNDAEEIFTRLMRLKNYFQVDCQRTILTSLSRHFDLLTAHFHTPGLDRTNNVTENLIKQLDRKLFLLSDFATAQSATSFINLWVLAYRFKPFSSSSFAFRNGFSPLQLAGVETKHLDWLNFAIGTNN